MGEKRGKGEQATASACKESREGWLCPGGLREARDLQVTSLKEAES